LNRLSPAQLALAGIVAAVWAISFFIPNLDPTARVGVQAAMMLVLGAVFGIRITKGGDAK
jgi:uncharacterized protein (DUF697 family)